MKGESTHGFHDECCEIHYLGVEASAKQEQTTMFREVIMHAILVRALHCMLSWRDLRVLSTRLADKSENYWLWFAHKHHKLNNTQTMYDVMEMRSTRILAHACFSIGRPRHHGLQVVLCSQP